MTHRTPFHTRSILCCAALAVAAVLFLPALSPATVSAPFPVSEPATGSGLAASFDGTNWLVGMGSMFGDAPITAQQVSTWGLQEGSTIDTGAVGGNPRLAFDGTNHLMVWVEGDPPVTTVRGRFIDTAGGFVGAAFAVGTGWDIRPPQVIFDGTNYFVAWDDHDVHDVFGQFVTPAGAKLGSGVTISNDAIYNQRDVDLAFDGTNILAVFVDNRSQSACYQGDEGLSCYESDLYGQFIGKSSAEAAGTLVGTNFLIDAASVPRDHTAPSVAFDGTNYLAVVTEPPSDPVLCDDSPDCAFTIVGRIIDPAGTVSGSEIVLSMPTGSMFAPFVAAAQGGFLVTWTDVFNDTSDTFGVCNCGEGTCWDIWGQFLDTAGAIVGEQFAVDNRAGNQFGGCLGLAAGRYLCVVNEFGNSLVGDPAEMAYGVLLDPAGTAPVVFIAATTPTAIENTRAPGRFTVSRTGETTAELVVNYAVSGTATFDVDYALAPDTVDTITIPAGAASTVITVTPINDLLPEPGETVAAALGAGDGYLAGPPGRATVKINRNDPLPLPASLDNTRVWQTGGNAPMFGQRTVKHDGVDAARPDMLGHSKSSWIRTTVNGPGKVSYWWKTSSEAKDKLKFTVDGVLKASRSGVGVWQLKTITYGPGSHLLKWEFKRDACGSAGLDTGFIDQVVITP